MLPVQCRMARAALGLSVRKLAEAARVAPQTIVRFEGGREKGGGATLIEIEDRGTRLIGCLDCNDWRSIDGLRRVKLAEDDVGALRKLRGERTVESP